MRVLKNICFVLVSLAVAGETFAGFSNSVPVVVDKGIGSFASVNIKAEKKDVLTQFGDDEIFISIGDEKLPWGLIREHIEDSVNKFPARSDIGAQGMVDARKIVFREKLRQIMTKYVEYAVVAQKAKRLGVTVDPAEYSKQREVTRTYYREKGERGKKMLSLIDKPQSFYEHNLTNGLLWMAYANQIVKPKINVSEAEIEERIASQHTENLSILATNEFKRALIIDLDKQAHASWWNRGDFDFAEAARQWSDCPSYDMGGVLTDKDDKPQHIRKGDVCSEMEIAYRALKPGEISRVVETPHSWHLLKLIERHEATDDDDEYVTLAHIMLEKQGMLPELTAEQAKHRLDNARLKLAMGKEFAELFPKTDIQCKIPLFDATKRNAYPKAEKAGLKNKLKKNKEVK